ncbi:MULTISPECIES: ABC transporter ATP-binding protein [Carnobacterium]|jgi:ABC-2 type transport system ATP-binding protein|uniref:ABC-type transporter ATP-binding protein EcsA n=2 Tax=Carnobacterium maltaromaticum TaxID=2751 RepID=K8EQ06_CARML|nr:MULTISPECIES: ABC transporter ATP-binding protein [Carnobacterium]KRN60703.1 ABC transporter, ATP-binding protein [Carnobacterium maltaromaticum DSM 20342]KRN71589.1 ABC transporter, ATP-binding protein [Carnobacterium maltaromaticum]KRN84316.1 ABC transporter, ATP-binding protein [Carnobacterium maltaromaticum]MBC9787047.1 ATP-binding cassette domain-containing protein [Carnobacterium maltaromaticum]MBC9808492.1 ATP-binding cassette domain-containing protein [Carnobacterium maltaromaticum]
MSLKVTNLTGGYSQVPVLKDISFEVEKGKLIGLIGLNGAGKSTAIKHIIGLMNPQKGSITIDELTLTADTEGYRKKFAFIPETPVLYEELTLKEHIELTAMAYDVPQDIAFQRAEKLLTSFRLSNKLDWFPANFSKGMKQKVMILCAFLVEPSLYIIDEPFLGLDPLGINALLELMNEMKEQGASILMSTHILATAERQCDGFVLLHNGEIKAQGTLEDLRASFQMPEATLDEIYIHLTKEEDQLNDDA